MDNSGTTKWLADNLVAIGGNLSGFWILVFFYLITSVLTEILSNNAAVVLMIPVVCGSGENFGFKSFGFYVCCHLCLLLIVISHQLAIKLTPWFMHLAAINSSILPVWVRP
jgi:di/tricarboxylate transporter